MPLRHGDFLDGSGVFRLVFKPQFGVDAVPVEMRHHGHHEMARADGEMDGMNDDGHESMGQFKNRSTGGSPVTTDALSSALRATPETSARPSGNVASL